MDIELTIPRLVGDGEADNVGLLPLPQPPFPPSLPPQLAPGLIAAPASTGPTGAGSLMGVVWRLHTPRQWTAREPRGGRSQRRRSPAKAESSGDFMCGLCTIRKGRETDADGATQRGSSGYTWGG
jgi:hypothetical protein